jgi:hypothetical protein
MFFLLFDFIGHLNNLMNYLRVIIVIRNLIGFGFDHLINLRLLLNGLLAFVAVIVFIVIFMMVIVNIIVIMVRVIEYIGYCLLHLYDIQMDYNTIIITFIIFIICIVIVSYLYTYLIFYFLIITIFEFV